MGNRKQELETEKDKEFCNNKSSHCKSSNNFSKKKKMEMATKFMEVAPYIHIATMIQSSASSSRLIVIMLG